MYHVAIVRNGKICETFNVKNLTLFAQKLEYLRKYTENNTTFFVMSEKDDCDIVSLSTGNVGQITKGLG